jgi:hypothetical protein
LEGEKENELIYRFTKLITKQKRKEERIRRKTRGYNYNVEPP